MSKTLFVKESHNIIQVDSTSVKNSCKMRRVKGCARIQNLGVSNGTLDHSATRPAYISDKVMKPQIVFSQVLVAPPFVCFCQNQTK
jgi:hypothetical protein